MGNRTKHTLVAFFPVDAVKDMPLAKVDDIRLYYELDGQGSDLLLIHGATSFLPMWQYVRPLVRQHFRVIFPELRGHGRSDKPHILCTMEMLAKDMIGLLDVLNIDKCIVAGHSLGGFIVQQMAVDFPERLQALILICTTPKVDVEAAIAEMKIRQATQGLPPEKVVEVWLEKQFFDSEKLLAKPGLIELLRADAAQQQTNLVAHGYTIGAAANFNLEGRLEEITVPTLIIQGDHDLTFPLKWGEFMRDHIPQAVLHVIKNTSHSVQLEQPEALVQAMVNFCKSL